MEPTKHIWMDGTMVPWDEANVHVLNHTMHYGGGAFEGIRCYNATKGTAIFRLNEHSERLVYSAKAIGMDVPYSVEELNQACIDVVRENELEQGYIRPLFFYGYGKMGLNPVGAPVQCIIACWPWGKYLGGDTVNIKLSRFIRIHPQTSVTDAKIVGHYVNSIQASLEVHGDDRFDEALFLDFEGNVAEGPGENIFMVKDGTLHTPQKGNILPGITRDSIMSIARDKGYNVEERVLHPDELYEADECFFTGTAAEVTGIVNIDERQIGSGEMGPITHELREEFLDTVNGKVAQYEHWLTYVS